MVIYTIVPTSTISFLEAQHSHYSPFREPRYVGQVRRPELEERHRHPAPRGLRYETSDRGLALMESCLQVPPPSLPSDYRDHDDVTGAAPGQPRQPRQRRGQPQAGAARRGGAGDRGGEEQDAAGRRAQGGAAADMVEDSVSTV